MADFTVRADHIDVEQIMRQIRARIRDKRGADYTEAEIRELASVKLDKFLDPRAVRSNLLQHYRSERQPAPLITPEEAHPPLYEFSPDRVYVSDRGAGKLLTIIRKILKPISKLFFHVDTIWDSLTRQAVINRQYNALFQRVHNRLITRDELDALNFEMFNNLVVEITRLGIENKNLRMQVESFGTRLDFDERRARALEGVVQYRPGAPVARPQQPALPPAEDGGDEDDTTEGGETRSARRRRRRRGRRRGPGEGGDQPQGQEPREQGARQPGGPETSAAPAYAVPDAESSETPSYEAEQTGQPEWGDQHQPSHPIEHAAEQTPGGEHGGATHYHSYAEPPVTSEPAGAPDGPGWPDEHAEREPQTQAAEPEAAWEEPASDAHAASEAAAAEEQPASEPYQPYEPTPSDRPAPQRVYDAPRRSDSDSGEPGPSQS